MLAGAAAFAQEPASNPEKSSLPAEKASTKAEKSSPSGEKTEPAKAQNNSKPGEKEATQAEEKAAFPFQIELLETHVRFEANGDSRKDLHTIVKINDPAGARQFARLGFDYNRGFQAVEIPLVKITHANGGTSEILPSAISDAPNAAVEKFPVYQDVRVKSVRILGLQEGDTLEYRVITTTTKPPLAPDFWLEHSFDRSGQVLEEIYELDMPDKRAQIRISPETPATIEQSGRDENARESYRWNIRPVNFTSPKGNNDSKDIVVTTFASWSALVRKLTRFINPVVVSTIYGEAEALAHSQEGRSSPAFLYQFVAQKIATVDLPFDWVPIRGRGIHEILASGFGTPIEKIRLLFVLMTQTAARGEVVAYSESPQFESELPSPDLLSGALLKLKDGSKTYFLDPGLEVAPFGIVPAKLRGRKVLEITGKDLLGSEAFSSIPEGLPIASSQKVNIDASIGMEGTLSAKVRYAMRGDNELVLRVAFHQTPKERWNEVAGLLALADGFRGHIESVQPSDPMETEKPFEVQYEITQPKFVDWSKKPVRIPALLPQIALPDAVRKGEAGGKIELGTPLEVETRLTLKLPDGTAVQTPPGTSVARDYATYASNYDGHLNTLTATRHVHFLMREIAGERAADYGAFVRAVQLDQAQVITLFPGEKPEKK